VVGVLRALSTAGAATDCDDAIGRYLTSGRSRAERDSLARGLWSQGVPPADLDRLETTLDQLKLLPKAGWPEADLIRATVGLHERRPRLQARRQRQSRTRLRRRGPHLPLGAIYGSVSNGDEVYRLQRHVTPDRVEVMHIMDGRVLRLRARELSDRDVWRCLSDQGRTPSRTGEDAWPDADTSGYDPSQ
jgi:hypothetical protein